MLSAQKRLTGISPQQVIQEGIAVLSAKSATRIEDCLKIADTTWSKAPPNEIVAVRKHSLDFENT